MNAAPADEFIEHIANMPHRVNDIRKFAICLIAQPKSPFGMGSAIS
jgi:hypothetical protein